MAKKQPREDLQPLTINQEFLFSAIEAEPDDEGNDAFVFATGYAGTGKTYVSTMLAAELMQDKHYHQIVIVKPTVGPDSNGFLPGTIEEKIAPWLETVTAPLIEFFGAEKFKKEFGKTIHAAPIEFIRGKTFDNAFIIVDEAQNLTVSQMKAVLTRIGKYSKMVFCGDDNQCDLPKKERSGLNWFLELVHARREAGIEVIRFTKNDCVRSGACKKALHIIESAND